MENQITLNQFCLLGLIFTLLFTSCQRSQFATTVRHYNNGRVTYTNSYPVEARKSSKSKSSKNHLKQADKQAPAVAVIKTDLTPEITRIIPVHEKPGEKLIASTSIEPMLIKVNENTVGSSDKPAFSYNNLRRSLTAFSYPDTIIKNNETKTGIKAMPSADTRKIEKHGLTGFILSILGLFPIIGLPLAILGVVFGARGLRKIHRDSTRYKGKGFASTSIILGVIGIIVSLLSIGMFIALLIWSNSGT